MHDHPHATALRRRGLIVASDLVDANGAPWPWQERRGLRVYRHGLDQGALLRPLGNTVYFMPPYAASEDELRWLAGVAIAGLEIVSR